MLLVYLPYFDRLEQPHSRALVRIVRDRVFRQWVQIVHDVEWIEVNMIQQIFRLDRRNEIFVRN